MVCITRGFLAISVGSKAKWKLLYLHRGLAAMFWPEVLLPHSSAAKG